MKLNHVYHSLFRFHATQFAQIKLLIPNIHLFKMFLMNSVWHSLFRSHPLNQSK